MNPAWAWAFYALSQGWAVFPLQPHDKRPLPGFRWRDESSSDSRTVFRWAAQHPDANVGLDLEKSGLLVLDVDVKQKVKGNYEPTMQGYHDIAHLFARHEWYPEHEQAATITASGGWHLVFSQPASGPLRGRTQKAAPLGAHIDVKASGGYVLVPGSHVPSRVHVFDGDDWYRIQPGVDWSNVPEVPDWLGRLISPPPAPPPAPGAMLAQLRTTRALAGGDWRQRVEDVARATGNRNDALNAAAYGLRTVVLARGGPSLAEVVQALGAACQRNGLVRDDGRRSVQATMASGLGVAPETVAGLW